MNEYLTKVEAERQRQLSQGKSENMAPAMWHLMVSDQLAMITRTVSLARYRGLTTIDGSLHVEDLAPEEIEAIKLGLVRLGACARAWYENADKEGT